MGSEEGTLELTNSDGAEMNSAPCWPWNKVSVAWWWRYRPEHEIGGNTCEIARAIKCWALGKAPGLAAGEAAAEKGA